MKTMSKSIQKQYSHGLAQLVSKILLITWDFFVSNSIKNDKYQDFFDQTSCGISKISCCLTIPEKEENELILRRETFFADGFMLL